MSTFENARECAIHEEVEPFEGERPLQCFECGHVYPDDEAILDRFRETYPNSSAESSDDVSHCPLCLHDW